VYVCGTIFAVLHNHNSSVSISHIAQRSNRSPQRSLEHLQEFPKLLSNPWFLERCEKISLQQLIIQSPNILGVGKNPPRPRNFTRRRLARILRGAKVATFSSFPRPSFAAVSVVAPLFFVEGRGASPLPTKEEVKTPSIYCSVMVFCRSLVLSTPPPPGLAAAAAAGICRVLSLCVMPLPRAVSLCHALAACLSASPCVL